MQEEAKCQPKSFFLSLRSHAWVWSVNILNRNCSRSKFFYLLLLSWPTTTTKKFCQTFQHNIILLMMNMVMPKPSLGISSVSLFLLMPLSSVSPSAWASSVVVAVNVIACVAAPQLPHTAGVVACNVKDVIEGFKSAIISYGCNLIIMIIIIFILYCMVTILHDVNLSTLGPTIIYYKEDIKLDCMANTQSIL